jgi:hypothetical protein
MSPELGDHGVASASLRGEIAVCLGSWEVGGGGRSRSVVSASFGEVGLGCSE